MKILLINNQSRSFKKLKLLVKHHTVIVAPGHDSHISLSKLAQEVDLILLSGGSNGHSVFYDRDYYRDQIDLVQQTDKPVIGICLGAHIITSAYSGQMKRLPRASRGHQHITMTKANNPFSHLGGIKVHQSHCWAIDKLGPHLDSLARSNHGHEIIRHRLKPIYGLQFHPEILPNYTGGAVIFNQLLRRHQPVHEHRR